MGFRSFGEQAEADLYQLWFNPGKQIQLMRLPVDNVLHLYGDALFQQEKIDDAEKAFAKAISWDPVRVDILSDYKNCFLKKGNMTRLMEIVRLEFRYAFRPGNLALCYRDMGLGFYHMKEYEAAEVCYLLSNVVQRAQNADANLRLIEG